MDALSVQRRAEGLEVGLQLLEEHPHLLVVTDRQQRLQRRVQGRVQGRGASERVGGCKGEARQSA